MNSVRLVHVRGTAEAVIKADGPNERGKSGGPLFDGDGDVVGVMFAGSSSLRDLDSHAEISESGMGIYAPNVIDWLRQSGVAFSASPRSATAGAAVLPTSAVVEIFCFQ